MPRIEKDKFDLLLNNSTLSKDELVSYGIIRKEKKQICVTLSGKEAKAYQTYCFNHDLNQSEMSRILLKKGMKEYLHVFDLSLEPANPRKSLTFLLPLDIKNEFREILKKKADENFFTESAFMRSCIVNFLRKEGIQL